MSASLLLAAGPGLSAAAPALAELRQALSFHASFDRGGDADFARGDARVYTAADRNQRDTAPAGLPGEELVRVAPGEGRYGAALEFRRKTKEQVFYRGPANLGFAPRHWNGSLSFWLRLDPERDLEPGYCDPVQFVSQAWTSGNLFVEFSKDHSPRHFRFVVMAVTKYWNPHNRKYEEMPDEERPMVSLHRPPFRRDQWTHVLVTYTNINSGQEDGGGRLYLDGREVGSFSGWNHTFDWDPAKSALTLGLNYIGFVDDLAVFDRELTPAEVQTVYRLANGIADLRAAR